MRYREVLRMPLWLLAIIYFFMLSLVISLWAALGDFPALISLIVVTIALMCIFHTTALRIEIDDAELRIGKAHIALEYIGESMDLNEKAIGQARTRDADPNAYLAIRFWVSTGVLLRVKDPRDKTPYWLVSSKKGQKLIEALKN